MEFFIAFLKHLTNISPVINQNKYVRQMFQFLVIQFSLRYFIPFNRRIIEQNGNCTPLTYNQFQRIIESMDPPPVAEMEMPAELLKHAITPLTDDHEDRFGVPTLDELGR